MTTTDTSEKQAAVWLLRDYDRSVKQHTIEELVSVLTDYGRLTTHRVGGNVYVGWTPDTQYQHNRTDPDAPTDMFYSLQPLLHLALMEVWMKAIEAKYIAYYG